MKKIEDYLDKSHYKSFRKNLKLLRESFGLTGAEVSRELMFSESDRIRNLEYGKGLGKPYLWEVEKIAAFFKVTTLAILDEDLQIPDTEEYKILPEFPFHKIFKKGFIQGPRKKLPGYIDPAGYVRCIIKSLDGSNKGMMVHRLVAKAFVDNPFGYSEINHKDGIKDNNDAENLEWCSRSMNIQHAYDTGLKVAPKGKRRLVPSSLAISSTSNSISK